VGIYSCSADDRAYEPELRVRQHEQAAKRKAEEDRYNLERGRAEVRARMINLERERAEDLARERAEDLARTINLERERAEIRARSIIPLSGLRIPSMPRIQPRGVRGRGNRR
jgi:hypothetical protein